jgi:callose synthase
MAGFVTFAFLEPLFVQVGSEISAVFLYILTADSAAVGMALGVLLPLLFPGFCLGAAVTLFVMSFMAVWNSYFFPVVGGVLAILFSIISARYDGIKTQGLFFFFNHSLVAFIDLLQL